MSTKTWPRAIPLVTVDPHFNIWSFSDHLYDDTTKHWTGQRHAMTGLVRVDGEWFRFMGKVELYGERYFMEPKAMEQKSLELTPTKTVYVFENEKIELEVTFLSTLLLTDLDLMTRPVSYITYKVTAKDGQKHDVLVAIDVNAELAVNTTDQQVMFGKDAQSIFCGRGEEGMLTKSGDDMRIDWGWLHLSAPGHKYAITCAADKRKGLSNWPFDAKPEFKKLDGVMSERVKIAQEVRDGYPSLGCYKSGEVSGEAALEGLVVVSYDDIYSIEYFGKQIVPYWKRNGMTFDEVLAKGIAEYPQIAERMAAFDEELKAEALEFGQKYYEILCVAYRESIAAHKLIEVDGELKFFSKECYSNGCIGTVDVTYPSIPLYLKYCPELVEGMINPIFHYVAEGDWHYEFAPHDVGQYPLANGQVYGFDRKTRDMQEIMQMPVEECGNMLLCVAAICRAKDSVAYAEKHKEILTQWAEYLVKIGWNPENQLCTDDFAGHLAHNCNLSIKGILGIAAWAKLLEQMGDTEKAAYFRKHAEELAVTWEKEAFDGDHYRLTFDGEGTWSLKYNLIWDKILELHVFDEKIAETEVKYYLTKMNPYGIPLDSRCDYSKSDWMMWTTVLTDNAEYREKVIDCMWEAMCNMDRRAPFPDWYHTEKPIAECFQNRTVQGGLFILLMK